MHKSRLASILLGPSLLSATVSTLLSVLVLGIASWSYIKPDNGFYDYLFGPYGLTTVLQNSTNALSAVNGVFSSPAAYNVAVALFALFIGLLVYVFLEGMDHVATKTSNAFQEVELISDQVIKKRAEHQAELRLGLRLATLVVWIMYLIFFARVIVPFCILIARLDTTQYLLTWHNVIAPLIGLALLLISMHVHVICMRLLVLRPRMFGGESVIVGRGGHDN
ncbi:MAG: hypothetical protein ABWX94_01515 [Candidatus Saccharimonadales bacterium]